jgi:hypothetical protein
MANDIADLVRSKAHICRHREIMNPDFDFPIAGTNVNMGWLVPLIRVEESTIGAPP